MRGVHVGLAAALALVGVLAVTGLAQPSGPSGIHAAYGEDPARSAIVAWMADPSADTHVAYGTDETEETVEGQAQPAATSARVPYRATIEGLQPDTTYRYQVLSDGQASEEHTFTTAPKPGSSADLRITAFADHGLADEANRGDGDAPTRNTELAASLDPDLHLLAGDLSYAEGRAQQWNTYTEQIQTLAAGIPFMTVPGNHEREPVREVDGPDPDTGPVPDPDTDEDAQGFHHYDARFPMPTPEAEDERWWTIQHGDVLIVGLNTERACAVDETTGTPDDPADDCEFHPSEPYQPQLSFLEEVLAEASEDPSIAWTVLLVHHPFWSTGGHGSTEGLQDHYMPLVDEHGVDVVVQGHDHLYERSHLLREGRVVDEGTLYVTNGAGGSGFYSMDEEQPEWSNVRDNATYGTLVLDIEDDQLEGRFVSLEGETVDRFAYENAGDGLRVPGEDGTTEAGDREDGQQTPASLVATMALLAAAAAARRR